MASIKKYKTKPKAINCKKLKKYLNELTNKQNFRPRQ